MPTTKKKTKLSKLIELSAWLIAECEEHNAEYKYSTDTEQLKEAREFVAEFAKPEMFKRTGTYRVSS